MKACTIIGKIASDRAPHLTNDAWGDERVPNKGWLKEHGLVSFAGHPLVFQGELLGVLGLFARRPLTREEFDRLPVFASQAAIVIRNAQLYTEVAELRDRLEAENAYLREEIEATHAYDDMVGESERFRAMLDTMSAVADTDATILVLGETGTGKELLARAAHQLSARRERPLVRVNCAAISAGLVESELFGHEKGAFTGALERREGRFELAEGGTIFLDEIGELPLETQSKLLRVLQEGEFERVGSSETLRVDVRVIAATNRDLREEVEAGRFRADLFYRLNVFPLEVPPLRDRREDIPLIARRFAEQVGARLGRSFDGIDRESLERLQRYSWPGNVRELQNVIERAAILSPGPLIRIGESFGVDDAGSPGGSEDPSGGARTLEEMERAHIRGVLESTGWKVEGDGGAARILDLNPSTLRSRMRKLGIVRPG